jgi:hypothetical protein
MENHPFYKIECLHTFGTTEFEGLKVTAPNLFHPTVSPLSLRLRHSLQGGKEFHILIKMSFKKFISKILDDREMKF